MDFQVDVSTDGRQIRFCNAVDEFTRQALATTAARSFTADDTTILLDKIIAETGRRPQNLRMDNGPELTAAAMRDWCRFGKGLPAPSGLLIEFAALSEQRVYGRMLALVIISQTAVGRGRTPLGGR
ncbi:MAG: DDE-type integrase/transposase/recombinase [Pseudonocardiales bacterium]|nr:DDE-type integrase/transposase/recombinase [Pseudonocardiales bacterium]